MVRTRIEAEVVILEIRPSQWLNLFPFVACILLFWLVAPALWALWRFLEVRNTVYRLSTQRLSVKTGVLNIEAIDIEHYRIKDHALYQPFFFRMVGLGNIDILTSDATYRRITLRAIREPAIVREQLRALVESVRVAKGVREIDWFVE